MFLTSMNNFFFQMDRQTASKGSMIPNSERGRMRKEEVVVYFKIVAQNLSTGTWGNQRKMCHDIKTENPARKELNV